MFVHWNMAQKKKTLKSHARQGLVTTEEAAGTGDDLLGNFALKECVYLYIGNTLWWTNSLLLKMAIDIVDVPIKNGEFLKIG